jgi:predicted RNase H-like nuclease (RuvC/YqgF family)
VTVDSPGRPSRGRPRKWADSAERGRAYRARKARQLAEPLALRRAVEDLRATLRDTKRALGRERRTADQLKRQLEQQTTRSDNAEARSRAERNRLERQVAELHRRAESAEYRADRLAEQLQQIRTAPERTERPLSLFGEASPPGRPQLNRAQRRALERRRMSE